MGSFFTGFGGSPSPEARALIRTKPDGDLHDAYQMMHSRIRTELQTPRLALTACREISIALRVLQLLGNHVGLTLIPRPASRHLSNLT